MPRETLSRYHHPDRKETAFGSKTAWIYPGQGIQWVGMGNDLFKANYPARRLYQIADRILGFSISKISFEGPEQTLNRTLYAQPSIFILNEICRRLLSQKSSVRVKPPETVAGHSLGEFNALVAAKAISFKQALWLVGERAKAMDKACKENPGGMIAVNLRAIDERLLEMMRLFSLEMSISNSHEQTVLAGRNDRLEAALSWMENNNIRGILLNVEGAFHSRLMEPAVKDFSKALAQVDIEPAKIPIVGNTTATLIQTPEEIRRELLNQLTHPVLWKDSLVFMTRHGIGQTIEIGEKGILSSMNVKVNGGKTERLKAFIEGVAINFVVWRRQPQAASSLA